MCLLFFTKILVFTEIKAKLPKMRNSGQILSAIELLLKTHAFNISWEAEKKGMKKLLNRKRI